MMIDKNGWKIAGTDPGIAARNAALINKAVAKASPQVNEGREKFNDGVREFWQQQLQAPFTMNVVNGEEAKKNLQENPGQQPLTIRPGQKYVILEGPVNTDSSVKPHGEPKPPQATTLPLPEGKDGDSSVKPQGELSIDSAGWTAGLELIKNAVERGGMSS